MCLICAEMAKGKLTSLEARRNFSGVYFKVIKYKEVKWQ